MNSFGESAKKNWKKIGEVAYVPAALLRPLGASAKLQPGQDAALTRMEREGKGELNGVRVSVKSLERAYHTWTVKLPAL